MKCKTYFFILAVLFILLFYNLFCYSFANKRIKDGTRYLITNYLQANFHDSNYEYIKTTTNHDGSLNLYIKTEDKGYYRFVISHNGSYQIIFVDQTIPAYIR